MRKISRVISISLFRTQRQKTVAQFRALCAEERKTNHFWRVMCYIWPEGEFDDCLCASYMMIFKLASNRVFLNALILEYKILYKKFYWKFLKRFFETHSAKKSKKNFQFFHDIVKS